MVIDVWIVATGAKMTNLLEPTRTDKALQLITKPESCSSHVNLEVRLPNL